MFELLVALASLVIAHNFFRPKQKPPRGLRPNCLLTRHPVVFMHGLKNFFIVFDYWNGIISFLRRHGYDCIEPKSSWRAPAHKRKKHFKRHLLAASQKTGYVHIIAHSMGALDALEMACKDSEVAKKVKTLTLVTTPLGGTVWSKLAPPLPWNDLRKRFSLEEAQRRSQKLKIPPHIKVGVVTASSGKFPRSPALFFHKYILNLMLRRAGVPHDSFVTVDSQKKFGNLELKTYWHFPGDHFQAIGAGPWPLNEKTSHEYFLDHCIWLAEFDLTSSQ